MEYLNQIEDVIEKGKYKDNWQKTFPKIKIYVECNIKIIGSGINNSSLKKRLSKWGLGVNISYCREGDVW